MTQFETSVVGKRICYEGAYLGTVRFYGEVPPASGKYWYGVEWDDVSRGKHSGEHQGIRYFECRYAFTYKGRNGFIFIGIEWKEQRRLSNHPTKYLLVGR